MKILTINAGSSSLKYMAYEMPSKEVLLSGQFERIGLDKSFYSVKIADEKIKKDAVLNNHGNALNILKDLLLEFKVVDSLDEIKGVGHRVVHGGDTFSKSVVITDEVIKHVEKLSVLAPLHNPPALMGIRAAQEAFKNATHVAIFDTAFHQTIASDKFIYALPYELYEDMGIRKYGFHGTSHKYITQRMQQILNKEDVNLIIAHIGNGASMSAIKNGKCFDTSMGFTPTSGLVMGTRCGDIDPSIVTYLLGQGKTLEEVDNIMNKKSGLLGISCISSDARDVEKAALEGDKKAKLAARLQADSVINYIARYHVELEKVDAICFTAGLGENSPFTRANIVNGLKALGINLDEDLNNSIASYLSTSEGIITNDHSSIPIYVIPTNEELMIASDTYDFIK